MAYLKRAEDTNKQKILLSDFPDFSVYDNIAQPVFVLTQNAAGRVVYVYLNTAGCRYLDLTLEEVTGKPGQELFGGRAGQSVEDRQNQAWLEGKPTSYEIALPVKDGGTFWARTMLEPVHDIDGRVAYMVGISANISREVQLRQAQAMTEAIANEMEDFVSLAAHDLRSPIANVKSLTGLVRHEFVDMGDGKLKMIDMIENICTKALTLLSDVMSQAAAANAGSDTQTFDLDSLCDDILVTLDPGRKHVVTVQKTRIHADHTAIQIILRNLIDNSFKHAAKDRARLEISVCAAVGDRISVTVSDDGTGFSDPALAFLDGGKLSVDSGFGLLGVRRLIRSRGGDISALPPASGQGAEVRFELPGQIMGIETDKLSVEK